MEEVDEAWTLIERWAEEHFPALSESLRGGADARTIAGLEVAIGSAIPVALRASLGRHDGQLRLPHHRALPGLVWYSDVFLLLPVERMIDETLGRRRDAARDPNAPAFSFDPLAVAWAGNGDTLSIDLAIGDVCAELHDEEDGDRGEVASLSYGRWLHRIAEDLGKGRYRVAEWGGLEPNLPPPVERAAIVEEEVRVVARSGGGTDAVYARLTERFDQPRWLLKRVFRRESLDRLLSSAHS